MLLPCTQARLLVRYLCVFWTVTRMIWTAAFRSFASFSEEAKKPTRPLMLSPLSVEPGVEEVDVFGVEEDAVLLPAASADESAGTF